MSHFAAHECRRGIIRSTASLACPSSDSSTAAISERVVVALAAFVGFAMINRTYVAPFATVVGQMMLVFVVALYAATVWWLHRLASPAPGHRFLPNSRRRR